jgi:hypothetical protein
MRIIEKFNLSEVYVTTKLPPISLLSWYRFVVYKGLSPDEADEDEIIPDSLVSWDRDVYPFQLSVPALDVESEIWALRFCITETKVQLANMATTANHDANLLSSPEVKKWSYRKSVALGYRVERKKIWLEAQMFCERALKAVEDAKALIKYEGDLIVTQEERVRRRAEEEKVKSEL